MFQNLKKLAITELTVNYKLTTPVKTLTVENRSGEHIAGARVTAFLEFTDSEPIQADYQGITNHFYRYFQKALKANGIDTVGWNEVTASEFYTKSGGGLARILVSGGIAKQFAFRKELDPVLIQTSREKYLAAATHAVEKWVDAFVVRCVEMRKG